MNLKYGSQVCGFLESLQKPGEPNGKIDQSDSFLPTKVLAYKTILYFKIRLNK